MVDAGAHRGEFSAELNRRFGCKCHLIEPNPTLAQELAASPTASITQAALSSHDGRASFHLAENLESSSLPSSVGAGLSQLGTIEVETVTLATLMERLAIQRIDLLKLDVEGAEFDLINATSDDTWRRIRQVTVEFHDFQSRFAGRNLFELARNKLESVGFVSAVMSFRTHGDVLFLNRRALDISFASAFYLRYAARFIEKAKHRFHWNAPR